MRNNYHIFKYHNSHLYNYIKQVKEKRKHKTDRGNVKYRMPAGDQRQRNRKWTRRNASNSPSNQLPWKLVIGQPKKGQANTKRVESNEYLLLFATVKSGSQGCTVFYRVGHGWLGRVWVGKGGWLIGWTGWFWSEEAEVKGHCTGKWLWFGLRCLEWKWLNH